MTCEGPGSPAHQPPRSQDSQASIHVKRFFTVNTSLPLPLSLPLTIPYRFCFFGEPWLISSPYSILTKFLSLSLCQCYLCIKYGLHYIIMVSYYDITAWPQCGLWITLHDYNIVSHEIMALPPCHQDSIALCPLHCGARAARGMLGCAGRRVREMVSEPLMVWEPPRHGLGLGRAIPDGSLAAPRLLPRRRY